MKSVALFGRSPYSKHVVYVQQSHCGSSMRSLVLVLFQPQQCVVSLVMSFFCCQLLFDL